MAIKGKRKGKNELKLFIITRMLSNPNKKWLAREIYHEASKAFKIRQRRGINEHLKALKQLDLIVFDKRSQNYSLPKNWKTLEYLKRLEDELQISKSKQFVEFIQFISKVYPRNINPEKDIALQFVRYVFLKKNKEELKKFSNLNQRMKAKHITLKILEILLDAFVDLKKEETKENNVASMLKEMKEIKSMEELKKYIARLEEHQRLFYPSVIEIKKNVFSASLLTAYEKIKSQTVPESAKKIAKFIMEYAIKNLESYS